MYSEASLSRTPTIGNLFLFYSGVHSKAAKPPKLTNLCTFSSSHETFLINSTLYDMYCTVFSDVYITIKDNLW